MTEVRKMTAAELNRALAELMRYSVCTSHNGISGKVFYYIVKPDGRYGMYESSEDEAYAQHAPRYCTDPAASLEVEKAAIQKNPYRYPRNLESLMEWNDDEEGEDYIRFNYYPNISKLLTATPRQRAEAAYMTLSGGCENASSL